jgi:nucleotide-binding universal stress UspA family protein
VPRESPAATEITDLYRQKGEEIIADAVFFFKEEGMSVERRLLEHADPAEAIIQEARRENCDLMVMGRSGGEGESKPHLGSVAAEVSNRAKIPVLVAADRGRMLKILVPVDGSKASEKAADYGGVLAKKAGVGMTLLYVQESGLFRLRPEVTKKIGTDILSSVARRLEGVKADERLESGDPARTIIQVADEGDYDLIVMGGRGHSAVRHIFLGSVSDHVLHYADRAVLLVK